MFSKAKKPSGSQGTERAGIKGFLDFASLCDKKQATYPSLDALFVAWGQWAIRPEALFDATADVRACAAQREALKQAHHIASANHNTGSFRTYINSVARAYTAASPARMVVPSSIRQFPTYNVFFAAANTRDRARGGASGRDRRGDDEKPARRDGGGCTTTPSGVG
jgi:hypothetical protein